jgi:hypothetical protein
MVNDVERVELFTREHIEDHPIFLPDGPDKRLFDAISKKRLVIFFGAGVSMLGGCASWGELARNIVSSFSNEVFPSQEKEVLKEMSFTDPRRTISICYNRAKLQGQLEQYYAIIKKSVTPPDEKQDKFKAIHRKLLDLNAITYVTTNIDMGIESVGGIDIENKEIINLTTRDDDFLPSEKIRKGNIFYLHGAKDAIESTIFTVDSYINYYEGAGRQLVKRFLMDLFGKDYCVLFIGYSLEEQEILQNIFMANVEENTGDKREYKHFILAPIYSKDLAKFNINRMYLDIYSVRSIPYFIDYDGYDRLNFALEKLREHIEMYEPDLISVLSGIGEESDDTSR